MLNGLINRADADVTLKWSGYDTMQPELREVAQDAAVRIHTLQHNMVASAAEMGDILLSIKGNFSHGQWGDWLAGEFDWSDRTAQHWMNAAIAVRKNETFSLLPASAQYALGSKGTPEAAVEEIADRMEAGETPTVQEVKATIKKHKPPKPAKVEDHTATAKRMAAQLEQAGQRPEAGAQGPMTDPQPGKPPEWFPPEHIDQYDDRPLPAWVHQPDGTETRAPDLDGSQMAQRNLRICDGIRIGLAQIEKVLNDYETQTGDFDTRRKLQPLLDDMAQNVANRMRALG